MAITLLVDGEKVPLNDFTSKMLTGIILGAVASLKNVKHEWRELQIEISQE